MSPGLTLAVFNVKGGVGKTTTAVNLSYLAARGGDRTLLIDLDPQGAATHHFQARPAGKGGAKRLVEGDGMEERLVASGLENLDLLPADVSYRNLDLALDATKKPRQRLLRLLAPLREHYRYIFIDCAPTLSLVSESILEAADVLLVPTIPTPLSLQALTLVVKRAGKADRTPLILPFFSMADRRRSLHREICADPRGREAGFLETVIPYASVVEQMPVRRSPLPASLPKHETSRAFEALWAEVLRCAGDRAGSNPPASRKVPAQLRNLPDLGPVTVASASAAAGRDGAAPAAERVEREIKLLVPGEKAFLALGELLVGKGFTLPQPETQFNHFFDTRGRALGRKGLVLRLREQGKRCTLTAKGPASRREAASSLMSKAEEEVDIAAAEASDIVEGATSPLEVLEARVAGRPALLRALREAVGDKPLAEIGAFRNTRRSVGPITLSTDLGQVRLRLDLDRTEFPGDRVDHEVEAEIIEGDAVGAVARFREIFREAGIPWRPARSKPRRFFAALEAAAR